MKCHTGETEINICTVSLNSDILGVKHHLLTLHCLSCWTKLCTENRGFCVVLDMNIHQLLSQQVSVCHNTSADYKTLCCSHHKEFLSKTMTCLCGRPQPAKLISDQESDARNSVYVCDKNIKMHSYGQVYKAWIWFINLCMSTSLISTRNEKMNNKNCWCGVSEVLQQLSTHVTVTHGCGYLQRGRG